MRDAVGPAAAGLSYGGGLYQVVSPLVYYCTCALGYEGYKKGGLGYEGISDM